ncbi:MAG: hypothetical protein OXG78_17570 [Chloroflexi bacterium]|nr:hypothetical protein [Chloroflexota bacterium]
MSRINFEWNIESQQIDRSDAEDPQLKLKRRRTLIRFLLLVAILLAAVGIGALAVRQRLIDVQTQFAQLLQDTVKAEVAAIRIGDLGAWLKLQSAVSDEWRRSQMALFRHYEARKAENSIELTGSIVSVQIDDTRARVLVQENIQGLPYLRLWFYRLSDGSWLHVPPDFSFWGEERQYTPTGARLTYQEVDKQFAIQVGDVIAEWRMRGCNLLNCGALPTIQIDILPRAAETITWADERSMHLRLRSPYVELARADLPFDGAYRLQVSKLLAKSFVQEHSRLESAIYPNDAVFLLDSAVNWLSEWLVGVDPGAGLIQSLAQNYGVESVARLLSILSSTDDMSIVREVLPVAIEEADLDWRGFIEWRLQTEAELIAARAEDAWLPLYDTSNETVRMVAYQRFNQNLPSQRFMVVDQVIWTTEEGDPQLKVTAESDYGDSTGVEVLLFNLVDQVWKRAS